MSRKRVLITGGSRGIGNAIASHLAEKGWRVVVVARDRDRVDAAVSDLRGDGHLGLSLDVGDEIAWRQAMDRVDTDGALDGVVTAAGVLGPIGSLADLETDAFLETLRINLVGTLLALRFALPRIVSSGGAAVTLSGGGATSPLPRYDAYAAAKAAVVRLTENLAADGSPVNCVAPGFIATDIHKATLQAGPQAAGWEYFRRTEAELEAGGAKVDAVCDLVEFLLSESAGGIRGKLISAQWDPWRDPQFRDRLANDSDLGTLRRIDDMAFGRL